MSISDAEEYLLNNVNNECGYLISDGNSLDLYVKLFVLIFEDSEEGIRNTLAALENYCREWKLKVNCSKTKVVIFGRGRIQTEGYDFKYTNEYEGTI